ncbi:MAG: hypothetical protein KDA60_18870 [Planctomycetales bacterium]|nr:hypothetical protein [Planctomycetales bacterium]
MSYVIAYALAGVAAWVVMRGIAAQVGIDPGKRPLLALLCPPLALVQSQQIGSVGRAHLSSGQVLGHTLVAILVGATCFFLAERVGQSSRVRVMTLSMQAPFMGPGIVSTGKGFMSQEGDQPPVEIYRSLRWSQIVLPLTMLFAALLYRTPYSTIIVVLLATMILCLAGEVIGNLVINRMYVANPESEVYKSGFHVMLAVLALLAYLTPLWLAKMSTLEEDGGDSAPDNPQPMFMPGMTK